MPDSLPHPIHAHCLVTAPAHRDLAVVEVDAFVRALRASYRGCPGVGARVDEALTSACMYAALVGPSEQPAELRRRLLRAAAEYPGTAVVTGNGDCAARPAAVALRSRGVVAELHRIARALETRFATGI